MSFQQAADPAVTFGRRLQPRSGRRAGVFTGGILASAMLASTAGAGSMAPDRHLVKAPEAVSQVAASGHGAKSETTAGTSAVRSPKSGAPEKTQQKPDLVSAARSLAAARSADWTLCRKAAAAIESRASTPEHLLSAVSLTETGRREPKGKSLMAWPWTINVGGKGYVFTTKEKALRAVRHLLAQGYRSIDIGCMQVNLKYHPRAFTSLEEAFDPLANLAYGAEFLTRLKNRHGSWDLAVQHYHSYTEEHRQRYAARFNKLWALERRRMAAAAKAVKTTAQAHSGGILARLPANPLSVVHMALPDFEPLRQLRPLASLMAFGVNIEALRMTAGAGKRFLQRLGGSYPAIEDTRMQSASIAGPVPVN